MVIFMPAGRPDPDPEVGTNRVLRRSDTRARSWGVAPNGEWVCEDAGHDRSAATPGRSGPRAAAGGHRTTRTGVRAGGRGHRQNPHDHPSDRLSRPTRTRCAATGARGDVHCSGGGGDAHSAACARRGGRAGADLPRGGLPATALLLATGARNADVAADGQQVPTGRTGREQGRAVHRARGRPGPRRRDRVGQVVADRPRAVSGRRGRRRPRRPGAAGAAQQGIRGLRAAQEPGAGPGFRRFAAAHRGDPGGTARDRRGVPQPVPVVRRGRVPGRQSAATAGARRLAGQPRRPHRGGRREPDDLLVRGRLAEVADRLSAQVPGCHPGAVGAGLPVHAAGGRLGEPGHRSRAGAAGRHAAEAGRAAPGRPAPGLRRVRRRDRRGRRDRAQNRATGQAGCRAIGDGRAVPGQRAVGGLREGPVRRRDPLPGARRRAVLRARRGAPGNGDAARRGRLRRQ